MTPDIGLALARASGTALRGPRLDLCRDAAENRAARLAALGRASGANFAALQAVDMTAPETFTAASKRPLTTGRRPDMTGICVRREKAGRGLRRSRLHRSPSTT